MMQSRHYRFGTFAFVSLLMPLVVACGSNDDGPATPAPAPQVGAGGSGGDAPPPQAAAGQAGTAEPTPTPGEDPGTPPLDTQDAGLPGEPLGPNGAVNLFTDLLGIPDAQVAEKITLAANRIFGIGTGESTIPDMNAGYRVYYELPQNPEQAFIWAADSSDIRSEGMSYGMMIAVQLDMPQQFDRLWNFAKAYMQFPADSEISAWRHYFRWQGSVNTADPNNWQVVYNPQTGPAPDGDEYFAAALFLADRRWGSDGAINYREEASAISAAMLNNQPSDGRTAIIDPTSNMVVFFPQGNSAVFSDPSYHLPAFYELFAEDGPEADAARWRQVAETSRQYFVTSAHPDTGLHPDYANFDGTPNAGGDLHDQFRYDAWRVVMNMAVDYTWGSRDERLKTQIEKYHTFFSTRLGPGNVTAALFALDGSNPDGGGSTALTATLATGALVSVDDSRIQYVQNLWDVQQQQGLYRYYQETVYMLGLLTTAGRYAFSFGDTPE
jgi:oligosaccharide reducing-end xylanase